MSSAYWSHLRIDFDDAEPAAAPVDAEAEVEEIEDGAPEDS